MKTPYTYSILRYVHDPIAGEAVNIGVLLYAPEHDFLGLKIEPHTRHLSNLFAGFDGVHFRAGLRSLSLMVDKLATMYHLDAAQEKDQKTLILERPKEITAFIKQLYPDAGLSFQFGAPLAGLTENPVFSLHQMFDRFIASRHPQHEETGQRTDDDVWTHFNGAFKELSVSPVFRPKTFEIGEVEVSFDHAFKNGSWQALQPIALDHKQTESMQRKAAQWVGNGVALKELREFGKIYFLMGKPQSPALLDGYTRAKNFLHKTPVDHEFIEEDGAEDFAKWLASYIENNEITASTDH